MNARSHELQTEVESHCLMFVRASVTQAVPRKYNHLAALDPAMLVIKLTEKRPKSLSSCSAPSTLLVRNRTFTGMVELVVPGRRSNLGTRVMRKAGPG